MIIGAIKRFHPVPKPVMSPTLGAGASIKSVAVFSSRSKTGHVSNKSGQVKMLNSAEFSSRSKTGHVSNVKKFPHLASHFTVFIPFQNRSCLQLSQGEQAGSIPLVFIPFQNRSCLQLFFIRQPIFCHPRFHPVPKPVMSPTKSNSARNGLQAVFIPFQNRSCLQRLGYSGQHIGYAFSSRSKTGHVSN